MRCGRKWGKTELCVYTLYRWALTVPNGQFYYIAPFYNQAAEIIWKPGRLQTFLGDLAPKYISAIHETDRRITFKNGSFIKLVGSDNFEAGRGFNPDGAVGDEYKDSDYRFYEGFIPNLIAKKAPILLVGTPPETFDHFFVRTEEDYKKDPRGAYFKRSTWTNPYIDKEELELEKQSAIAKGEWAKYMREIEAEIVPGGANAIFPMLEIPRYDEAGNFVGESRHVKNFQSLYGAQGQPGVSYKDWEFFAAYDPGSALCFAGLFAAVNKFTRQCVILDELYVTDRNKTSTRQIYPAAMNKMNLLCDRVDWRETYDYAAAWFQNEVQTEFRRNLIPCVKDIGKKEVKLSVIKDFLLTDRLIISDRCKNLISEMATYSTDEHGRIPKKNDHCIAEGTLITTSKGKKAIENIREGELVLTADGFKPVTKFWDNGEKLVWRLHLSNGKHLDCTSDHKIYTLNNGLRLAVNLRKGDILWSELNLKGKFTLDGKEVLTSGAEEESKELNTFTGKFGKKLMGKSLKETTFTTLTGILQTIQSKTSLWLVQNNIQRNIDKSWLKEAEEMSHQEFLIERDFLPQSGINLKREETGTNSTQKNLGRRWNTKKSNVLNVVRSTLLKKQSHLGKEIFSALITAVQPIVEKAVLTIFLASVGAERLLSSTSTPSKNLVHVVAKECLGHKKVYDLSIYQTPEYFASGVLVHNCIDSMRYLFNLANLNTNEKHRKSIDPEKRIWEPEDDDEFEDDIVPNLYQDLDDELYYDGDSDE